MTGHVISLDDVRKARAAKRERKPVNSEQRGKRRAVARWQSHLNSVWEYAHLLSDDELVWLSQITEASKAKGARESTNPWTGRTRHVTRPTSTRDAVRLAALCNEVFGRSAGEEAREWSQREREKRLRVATTLRRLSRPVP